MNTETLRFIPVGQIHRNPHAQRVSPLNALIAKNGGQFDRTIAGVLTVTPDPRGGFFAIDGATRAEWALKAFGPKYELPCNVLDTLSDSEQSRVFVGLNGKRVRIVNRVLHEQGLKAGDKKALLVEIQRLRLPRSSVLETLYIVLRQNGEQALNQMVTTAVEWWGASAQIPPSVLRGVLLFQQMKKVTRRKKLLSPDKLKDLAAIRRGKHAGEGALAVHVAAILAGARVH